MEKKVVVREFEFLVVDYPQNIISVENGRSGQVYWYTSGEENYKGVQADFPKNDVVDFEKLIDFLIEIGDIPLQFLKEASFNG